MPRFFDTCVVHFYYLPQRDRFGEVLLEFLDMYAEFQLLMGLTYTHWCTIHYLDCRRLSNRKSKLNFIVKTKIAIAHVPIITCNMPKTILRMLQH